MYESSSYSDTINRKIPKKQNATCHEFKIIDVAIVFDSSFCSNSESHQHPKFIIEGILSETSRVLQHQENLCLKVNISHLEGFCEINSDPFLDIGDVKSSSHDQLYDFREWFNHNRADVSRSASLLFTGNPIEDKYIGKSFKEQICRPKNAFGIVFFDPLIDNKVNANFVAHELMHILGVDPTTENQQLNNHQGSVTTTRDMLGNQTCLKTEKLFPTKFESNDAISEVRN